MAAEMFDRTWMWHPCFTEEQPETAGLFVHFRKDLIVEDAAPASLRIQVTADTRYKLYVNERLVSAGPVKGDCNLWFYDELDLAPYLNVGRNRIGIQVLRFFYATQYATSFPRLPSGGAMVALVETEDQAWAPQIASSPLWQTAIDRATILRVDDAEDDFLHIYERTTSLRGDQWKWVPATMLKYRNSTGLTLPWKLSPRMIPPMQSQKAGFIAIHNLHSSLPKTMWEQTLIPSLSTNKAISLPAGSSHQLDLEAAFHMTAFLRLCFSRPIANDSLVVLTYAESYEEEPNMIPYLRCKGNRRDMAKDLFGPRDEFTLQGRQGATDLGYYANEATDENILPFHFRTFRFIRLNIHVGKSDLVFKGFDVETVSYPLDVQARLHVEPGDGFADRLWETSIRTLRNCMHDCYEDCPFYEQLQYAMDTRSSALFTYYTSGDDRLARQAIIQLFHSFQGWGS